MSLDWNVSAVAAREGDDFVWPKGPDSEQRLNGWLECVIWGTMFTGICVLTDANIREFATRLRAWESAVGAISASRDPVPFDVITRCVGLRTNASPLSLPKFTKKLAHSAMDAADRAFLRHERLHLAAVTSNV